METHNKMWESTITSNYMPQAFNNIKGTMKYQVLELKRNKITKENRMLKRYFSELDNE